MITCHKGIHGLQFKYKNGLATSVCGTVLPTHQAKFTVIYNELGCNLQYISGSMQTHPSGMHTTLDTTLVTTHEQRQSLKCK